MAATITFGGGGAMAYTPNCIKVKLGQMVSFQGNFSNHPLRQACGPTLGTLDESSGQGTTFIFSALGTYGFYCEMHGSPTGSGMAGAIEVVR
jgi:plastocyanin